MVFVDDILIYTESEEQHADMIEWVLRRLQDEGYYATPRSVSSSSRKCPSSATSSVKRAWPSSSIRSRRYGSGRRRRPEGREVFLGSDRLLPQAHPQNSAIAKPLTDLTKDERDGSSGQRSSSAFQQLKDRLSSADVLAHPDPSRQYIVNADASGSPSPVC